MVETKSDGLIIIILITEEIQLTFMLNIILLILKVELLNTVNI